VGLTEEERARLDASSRARARGSLRIILLIVAAVGVVGYAAGLAAVTIQSGSPRGAVWIIAAVPVLTAVVLALLLHRIVSRRRQPLLGGTDRQTQKAAHRALRAGSTDDPRLDALVQDLRTTVRRQNLVLVVLFGATAIIQAVAFAAADEAFVRIMFGVAVAASLSSAALFWREHRRVRRYRGLEPASRRAKGHLRRLAGDQEV
jgi:hypothetical protein